MYCARQCECCEQEERGVGAEQRSEEVMASSSEAEDRAATSGEGRRTGGVLVEVNVTYS